jgi:hypothetical protein
VKTTLRSPLFSIPPLLLFCAQARSPRPLSPPDPAAPPLIHPSHPSLRPAAQNTETNTVKWKTRRPRASPFFHSPHRPSTISVREKKRVEGVAARGAFSPPAASSSHEQQQQQQNGVSFLALGRKAKKPHHPGPSFPATPPSSPPLQTCVILSPPQKHDCVLCVSFAFTKARRERQRAPPPPLRRGAGARAAAALALVRVGKRDARARTLANGRIGGGGGGRCFLSGWWWGCAGTRGERGTTRRAPRDAAPATPREKERALQKKKPKALLLAPPSLSL